MSATLPVIECAIDGYDAVAVIALDGERAPATCRALLARLPLTTDAFHTKWNGHELFAVLEPFADLPDESRPPAVQAGDVVLFHLDATYRAAPRHLRAAGLGAYAELGLFYGPLARSSGPAGELPCVPLGRIVAGLDQLQAAAQTMRRAGMRPMTLRRRD